MPGIWHEGSSNFRTYKMLRVSVKKKISRVGNLTPGFVQPWFLDYSLKCEILRSRCSVVQGSTLVGGDVVLEFPENRKGRGTFLYWKVKQFKKKCLLLTLKTETFWSYETSRTVYCLLFTQQHRVTHQQTGIFSSTAARTSIVWHLGIRAILVYQFHLK